MLFVAETDDFVVTEEATTFNSGTTSGAVCVSILNVNDTVIEDEEKYMVTFNSTDEAIDITNNIVLVTIIDGTTGEC